MVQKRMEERKERTGVEREEGRVARGNRALRSRSQPCGRCREDETAEWVYVLGWEPFLQGRDSLNRSSLLLKSTTLEARNQRELTYDRRRRGEEKREKKG
jgi:hypothetical protein